MRNDWPEEVLTFWFEELQPVDWFKKNEAVDSLIQERFLALYRRISVKAPEELFGEARQVLAAVIVLDQFPRNMFRGSSESFATDSKALYLAEKAIKDGIDQDLSIEERKFLAMPFQHSEDEGVQARSVEVFAALGDANTLDYARQHKQIIDRFGRFPHRNEVLGRQSTEEEIAFLKQPGSSF